MTRHTADSNALITGGVVIDTAADGAASSGGPAQVPALPAGILEALRKQLLDRAATLRLELAGAQGQEASRRDAERDRVGDRKDAAAETESLTVADAEMQRDLDEWQDVEAALQRLREHRYGLCADCGVPIALQRLQTQPAALRCTACQQQAEGRPASFRAPLKPA
jgi:DnaK suppressor protein